MKKIFFKHKKHWSDKKVLVSSLMGIALLVGSIFVNTFATGYATREASNPVNDILLDNIPVVNVDLIVTDGAVLFLFFVALILFIEPKRIPFTLKSLALFVLIRATFITLTHLGLFPERSFLDPTDMFRSLTAGGDYFFSGHTGMPFLIALIFWDEKWIRDIAIFSSVVAGISVLFGHIHYSIDVFAAFFITYTIFHIAQKFFATDYLLFKKEANQC